MNKKTLFLTFVLSIFAFNFHAEAFTATSGGQVSSPYHKQRVWPESCPGLWGTVEENDCDAGAPTISQECVDACNAFAAECVDGDDSWTMSYSIRCAELH